MISKIGLVGKRRAGKGSVASYLEEAYGFHTFSFGSQLKKHFHQEFPHIPKVPKPVKGYQHYGQLRRVVDHENIWIDCCFGEIERYKETAMAISNYYGEYATESLIDDKDNLRIIIDDVRQANEVKALEERGFTLIRVDAPTGIRLERIRQEGGDISKESLMHSTETDLEDLDVPYILDNDRDLPHLYQQIDTFLETIQGA